MNQYIPHIYNVAPWHFGMLQSEFLCQHIGSFSNNHDVVNNRVETHDVSLHFLKTFALKEIHYIANAFLDMAQAFNVSNSLSHRLVSCRG